jgi:hypothetical protein
MATAFCLRAAQLPVILVILGCLKSQRDDIKFGIEDLLVSAHNDLAVCHPLHIDSLSRFRTVHLLVHQR